MLISPSKFSDNPAAFMKTHEKALRDISNEVMFSGQTAATFKRYLSNADGKSILKQIYPNLKIIYVPRQLNWLIDNKKVDNNFRVRNQ